MNGELAAALVAVLSKLGLKLLKRIERAIEDTPDSSVKPADVATATESHIAADREGKIASQQAKERRLGDYGPGGE